MTAKENIKERLEKLGQAIGSDDSLVENIMSRIDNELITVPSAVTAQNIWTTIIKSPIIKLATAAAIIIIVFTGMYYFSGSIDGTTPAYGITDVPKILRQACTIHIKGWRCANVQLGLFDPNVMRPGREETRALWEYWVDMETGHMKYTQPGNAVIEGNEVSASVYTTVYDGEFIMTVNNDRKEVWFTKLTPYQQLLRKRKNSFAILQSMLLTIDSLKFFNKTNREKIGGQIFDIWEADLGAPSWGGSHLRIKTWISPRNGHLGKVEVWRKEEGYINWYKHTELSQIEYDVALPSVIFATEVPLGYTSGNTKETANVPRLFQNRNRISVKTDQYITSYACFTFNDGSVILGWSCTTGWPENSWESDSYQEAIFKDLSAGGELPKLPVEFYAVSPIGDDHGVQYHGRHLTYTRKENILHEWGLYVPERQLDKYYGRLGYNLFYRSNRKDLNRKGALTLGETGDIQIEKKRDFDLFVLGAMAELSDDGKAPENITYERVLRLAEQIRGR